MKVQILVPATAAGASLMTALSGLMIGSRATFLAVVIIVAVMAFIGHKASKHHDAQDRDKQSVARPVAPPRALGQAPVQRPEGQWTFTHNDMWKVR